MMSTASNTLLLHTRLGDDLIVAEQTTSRISAILVDEGDQPIQAQSLNALALWLYLRDDTATPTGGINSVYATDALNVGRGVIGNSLPITGGVLTTDSVVRLTVVSHNLGSGDLVAVRNVQGLRGANGDWTVHVVDSDTLDLVDSWGQGVYTTGGTMTQGLHLTLQPADNVIVRPLLVPVGACEWHELMMEAVYNTTSKLHVVIQFRVENLGLLT